ncbi:MAG TPA: hypothetical protein VKU39_11425 [Streptosporangiaceae bacterium]|nr:hypothetical protein [Streptosporangiaceae bacterium]
MSKASAPAPSKALASRTGTPARHRPRRPARPASTQDLIAQIWHTLEWRKTLQLAFIVTITGMLILTGLELLAQAMPHTTAVWSTVTSTITAVISYRAARRTRR